MFIVARFPERCASMADPVVDNNLIQCVFFNAYREDNYIISKIHRNDVIGINLNSYCTNIIKQHDPKFAILEIEPELYETAIQAKYHILRLLNFYFHNEDDAFFYARFEIVSTEERFYQMTPKHLIRNEYGR